MDQKSALTLCNVQKPEAKTPIFKRRQNLIAALENQMNKIRTFKEGHRVSREKFWIDQQNTIFFQLKYGKSVLELQKGKSTLKAQSFEELEAQIENVKQLCFKGDMDELLATASKHIRSNFSRKK